MQTDLVSQLLSASIRACGLGLVTFVGLSLFRVRSSATRHAMWTVALLGMLLQIPLGEVAPAIALKVLPRLAGPTQPGAMESAQASVPPAHPLASPTHARQRAKVGRSVSLSATLTGIYLAITMLLFVRMAFGYWMLRQILRDATPTPRLGPDVIESALFSIPGSVGFFRARVLLPRAWRNWDAARLRAVLAHERAHIRRRDWLIHLVSHINASIFWFHPLAWWMERELARLAEEACDDVALSEMKDREEYAATLVHIAHAAAAHGRVLSRQIISMATDSNVTRRVNRILNCRLRVSKPLGRLAWAALFAWSVPVIYLSATVNLAPVDRDSIALKHVVVPDRNTDEVRRPLLPEQRFPRRPIAEEVANQNLRPPTPPALSRREDAPLTICILVDNSGSIFDKRARVMAAVLALVRASKPHEEVCIEDFNDEVFNGLPYGEDFTSDIKEMEEVLTRIDSRGGKAMRDAVRMAIERPEQTAHNDTKGLVLITEGYDTSSKVTEEELLGEVKDSGMPVYCIGLLSESYPSRREAARLALDQLAEASGGQAFYPKNPAEVESVSHEIANEVGKR
jgi:beta-lactamase regulating signal transducer with metallopeptidase domain